MQVTVRRTGVTSFPVDYKWVIRGGTATNGKDYAPVAYGGGEIRSGGTESIFAFPILDDALNEGFETIELELTELSSGAVVGQNQTARLTITDRPTTRVEFSQATLSVAEDAGSVTVTVSRSGDQPRPFTVEVVSVPGTGQAGADYSLVTATLDFAADETSKTISVPILNDALRESDENFQLKLINPSANVTLGSKSTVEIRITDNDTGFEFTAPQLSATEGQPSIDLTVRRGVDLGSALTVDYATSDGTAKTGADYTVVAGTLVFAADELEKKITITVLDDAVAEDDKTFQITLKNPGAGSSLGRQSTANIALVDNDSRIRFGTGGLSVSENAGEVVLTVLRERGEENHVTVEFATSDGTAKAGLDYEARSGQIVFAPGVTSRAITIPTLNDGDHEGNESFAVILSKPGVGAGLVHPSSTTVTIEDNDTGFEFTFERERFDVEEGAGPLGITVRRGTDLGQTVSVDYSSSDGSARG